jgi:hypothetical protein
MIENRDHVVSLVARARLLLSLSMALHVGSPPSAKTEQVGIGLLAEAKTLELHGVFMTIGEATGIRDWAPQRG